MRQVIRYGCKEVNRRKRVQESIFGSKRHVVDDSLEPTLATVRSLLRPFTVSYLKGNGLPVAMLETINNSSRTKECETYCSMYSNRCAMLFWLCLACFNRQYCIEGTQWLRRWFFVWTFVHHTAHTCGTSENDFRWRALCVPLAKSLLSPKLTFLKCATFPVDFSTIWNNFVSTNNQPFCQEGLPKIAFRLM